MRRLASSPSRVKLVLAVAGSSPRTYLQSSNLYLVEEDLAVRVNIEGKRIGREREERQNVRTALVNEWDTKVRRDKWWRERYWKIWWTVGDGKSRREGENSRAFCLGGDTSSVVLADSGKEALLWPLSLADILDIMYCLKYIFIHCTANVSFGLMTRITISIYPSK